MPLEFSALLSSSFCLPLDLFILFCFCFFCCFVVVFCFCFLVFFWFFFIDHTHIEDTQEKNWFAHSMWNACRFEMCVIVGL